MDIILKNIMLSAHVKILSNIKGIEIECSQVKDKKSKKNWTHPIRDRKREGK